MTLEEMEIAYSLRNKTVNKIVLEENKIKIFTDSGNLEKENYTLAFLDFLYSNFYVK